MYYCRFLDRLTVARDACMAMTDIEQESCRVTCKTCQSSNCIDTLENDGCMALIRAHAVKPCKVLDFETRFKCRQTCGICQGAPVPIQLKEQIYTRLNFCCLISQLENASPAEAH